MGLTPLPLDPDLKAMLPDQLNLGPGKIGGMSPLPPAPPPVDVSGMSAGAAPATPMLKPLSVVNGSPRAMEEQAYQSDIQRLMPHPQQPGFFHKLGHILAQVGNVAGDIAAPGTMALIPGTGLNNQIRLGSDQRALAGLQGQDTAEQQADQQNTDKNRQLDIEQQRADQENPKAVLPWQEVKDYIGPNGEPVERNSQTGEFRVSTLPYGIKRVEPNAKPMEHVPLLGPDGKPTIANYHPDTGKYTDSAGNEIANPRPIPPPPNYGEMILPTKTATYMDPKTNLPTEFQWNEQTKRYDIPVGMSATNAYGHEAAQAGAVVRAGSQVISTLEANRDKLGTLGAWVQKHGLNTPIADPTLAGIQSQLASFAALNPAMHGARGAQAMEHFEKIIGGLQQNPDATIAGIRGIMQTAGDINPNAQPGGEGGKSFSLKQAMGLPFNKGKSEADVRSDLQKHHYTVTE